MTTGYSAMGKCFLTNAEATDAYFGAQPSFNYQGSFTYNYVKQAGAWKLAEWRLTTNALNATYGTPPMTFGTCTLDEPPQPYPSTLTCTNCGGGSGIPSTGTGWDGTYDYIAAGAAWTFAFSFVLGTWLIAKNMGIIINAIRRW